MRLLTFSSRNAKEILRDPLNVAFSLGFPVILLFLMSAIGANAPVSIFEIETLTPGITVFGLSFMTLFSATLIARDRETALLQRLYTTPLTSADFIFGYVLPDPAYCGGAVRPMLYCRRYAGANLVGLHCLCGAAHYSRFPVFYRIGASFWKYPQHKTGRRNMRSSADDPDCVVFRRMV